MWNEKTTILFDFDGTIVDTSEGITKGAAFALGQYGIQVDDLATLRRFIGPPLKHAFREFYGFDEQKADEAATWFRRYYRETGVRECRPYDGVERLLRHLKEHGKRVLLATSKPQLFAEQILERFDLMRYFDFISGSCLDGTRTEKPEVIAYALKHTGIQIDSSVMVGDRKFDIEGAHQFGLPCIGVLYGFGDRAEFERAGADAIASTPAELEGMLLKP